MTLPKIALIAVTPILFACEASQTTPSSAVSDCGQEKYQASIGQNIGDVTLPTTNNYRVISPDDVITMDEVPSRLNISVDEKGWIKGVSCG